MTPRSTTDPAALTLAMFHILLAMADQPRHGYAIMQEIERRTGGEFVVGPGTLYRSIHRLAQDGLIRELSDEDDDRRRRYQLTAAGRRAASAEARRLDGYVRWAVATNLLERGREDA